MVTLATTRFEPCPQQMILHCLPPESAVPAILSQWTGSPLVVAPVFKFNNNTKDARRKIFKANRAEGRA